MTIKFDVIIRPLDGNKFAWFVYTATAVGHQIGSGIQDTLGMAKWAAKDAIDTYEERLSESRRTIRYQTVRAM